MQQQAESYVVALRADHARFSRVLSMLGRDARRLEDEPKAVLPLLREAVDYIVNFQNMHHHPLEEIMFARLVEKSPSLAPAAARLTREHHAVGRAGVAMIKLIEDVSLTEKGRKARIRLARKLEQFARDMRTHIKQEEELLYSQVWTELSEQDWEELATAEVSTDPLAELRDERYPLLTQYVLEGATHSEVSLRNLTMAQALESTLGSQSSGRQKISDIGDILGRQGREACALSRKSIKSLPSLPPLHPRETIEAGRNSTREFGRAYARWWREWRRWLKG